MGIVLSTSRTWKEWVADDWLHTDRERLGMALRTKRDAGEASLKKGHQARVPVADTNSTRNGTVM